MESSATDLEIISQKVSGGGGNGAIGQPIARNGDDDGRMFPIRRFYCYGCSVWYCEECFSAMVECTPAFFSRKLFAVKSGWRMDECFP